MFCTLSRSTIKFKQLGFEYGKLLFQGEEMEYKDCQRLTRRTTVGDSDYFYFSCGAGIA